MQSPPEASSRSAKTSANTIMAHEAGCGVTLPILILFVSSIAAPRSTSPVDTRILQDQVG